MTGSLDGFRHSSKSQIGEKRTAFFRNLNKQSKRKPADVANLCIFMHIIKAATGFVIRWLSNFMGF